MNRKQAFRMTFYNCNDKWIMNIEYSIKVYSKLSVHFSKLSFNVQFQFKCWYSPSLSSQFDFSRSIKIPAIICNLILRAPNQWVQPYYDQLSCSCCLLLGWDGAGICIHRKSCEQLLRPKSHKTCWQEPIYEPEPNNLQTMEQNIQALSVVGSFWIVFKWSLKRALLHLLLYQY